MKRELTINGKHYSEKELFSYCEDTISKSDKDWEMDYCRFILEWLSDDDEILAQTSGSTGAPKQIRLEKQKMRNSAQLTGEFFGFDIGQKALLCMSTNFIAGKMMVVRAFQWELDLIPVAPDGHPLRNLGFEVDFAAMVPLQVRNSLAESANMNLIQKLLIGGGAVDSVLQSKLQKLHTKCYSSYGMTETVSHVAIKRLNGARQSDHFYAMPKVNFSTDERDCLCIHAPLLADGILVTNDVVELKDDITFQWLGRFDHVVNSGGIKLFPEQVEKKMEGEIDQDFFFAGMKDEHLGEKLVLFVENKVGNEQFVNQLREKMKSLLGKYEQAREIFCIPKFKRTPTGKIQREATVLLVSK